MPDLGNGSVFSQTDGSNNSGTAPSWSGSAAPSTLDDSGRALQGAVTREWNWRNFTLTATGTDNAKVLTYSVAPAAYYNGQRFAFIANTTNTGSATLNVNSLGAKTIKSMVTGTLTAIASGDMVAGTFVEVSYNSADDSFVWVNQRSVVLPTASATVQGIVELATDAETQTGTDTARAITPANLTAKEASSAQYRNNTADRILTTDQVWSAAGRVALSWTSGGTTAVDLSAGLNFSVTTATGNSTLGAPTNAKTGQSGFIEIVQDAVTPRTLAYVSAWVFDGGVDPTLTATASAKDVLYYTVLDSIGPVVHAALRKGVA
jgi:hypothetical protein